MKPWAILPILVVSSLSNPAPGAEFDEAIELLGSALSCPLKVQKTCEDDCGIVIRTRTLSRKVDKSDRITFRLSAETYVRIQTTARSKIEEQNHVAEYAARIADLDPAGMQFDTRWSESKLSYDSWPKEEERLIIPCRGNQTCISEKSYGDDNLSSITLRFCNLETADNAKAALSALLRSTFDERWPANK